MRRRIPSWRRSLSAPRRASSRLAGRRRFPAFPGGKAEATRNAGGAIMNAIAEQVPELFGGAADLTCLHQDDLQAGRELPRGSGRPQRLFRRARVRHGRGGEWNRRARRADSLRLDLLCLFRLLQAGDPAGGADAGALALRLYPRLDRRWAKTARRTSRSSTCWRCARFRG